MLDFLCSLAQSSLCLEWSVLYAAYRPSADSLGEALEFPTSHEWVPACALRYKQVHCVPYTQSCSKEGFRVQLLEKLEEQQ